MAPLFSVIREVTPSMRFCALKLCLVLRYEPTSKKNEIFSSECVFHDREGSRIHATIKNTVLEKFKPILKEGHLFAIKDVIVAENNMYYKTTQSKYKIIVVKKTQVCEFFEDTFPSYMYQFRSFSELNFDVIGKVVTRDYPQNKEIDGRLTKLINILLEDIDLVDDVMNYLDKSGNEPAILILQMCPSKKFKGETSISTGYHITKMLTNKDLDEIKDFRKRLSTECKTPSTISTASLTIAQSILEEISTSKSTFRTLEQIHENNEVGSFWVNAKIESVETYGQWYYLSCANCPKKVTPVGDSFYCEKCDIFDSNGKLRFKIQLRVMDHTGNALFLLWDRECVELIGKTAMDIRSQVLNEDSKEEKMPKEIYDLVDRKVLFKVQVKPGQNYGFSGSYTVMKLTTNSDIIENYGADIMESQESSVLSKMKSIEQAEVNEVFEETCFQSWPAIRRCIQSYKS